MLVLSRRKDESIVIGDDIEVRIVEVRGDRVRIGISVPDGAPVHRSEVLEAVRRTLSQDQPTSSPRPAPQSAAPHRIPIHHDNFVGMEDLFG
jgi:carbon storage regulator